MAVFTMATALLPHASAIEGGLEPTVLSFTVMTYTTVLVMVNVWDQIRAGACRDFL